jgi:hypothetical protein
VSDQLDLGWSDKTIQERFEAFHAENPEVYQLLCRYSREAKSAGRNHYGIEALFSRIRWHKQIETRGDDFKLNNDFRSRYARLLMQKESDLDGFFELRNLRSE